MQVIQCLHKIGVGTFPAADLVQLPGIGAVPSPYHHHGIDFGGNFPRFSLSLLCCVADSIHNTNIITFFSKNFN